MTDKINPVNLPEKVDDVSDEELAKYVKTEHSTIIVKETILKNKTMIANFLCLFIIVGFLVCILLVLGVYLFSSKLSSAETTDLLKTISTLFGTALGFVLGYLYNVKS